MIHPALAISLSLSLAQPTPPPPPAPAPATKRPPDAVKPETVSLDPDTIWRAAVNTYRHKRTAERVTVSLKLDKQVRTSDFTIRFDPGAAVEASPDLRPDRAVLLELGPLRAHAHRGTLTVWSTQNDATYFLAQYTGEFTAETLQASLPPVPAPQLAAAADLPANRAMTLAAYLPDVRWAAGSVPLDDARAPIIMPGVSPNGTLHWEQDQRSGRLRRFTASIKSPALEMSLACTPTDPGEPASWKIDIAKRKRVATVSELARKPEPAAPASPASAPTPSSPAPANPAPGSTPSDAPTAKP